MNSITIDHVSTMTATTIATMTHVPATRSATAKPPQFQLDTCKATCAQHKTKSPSNLHLAGGMISHIDASQTSLLLLQIKDGPVIMTTNYEPSLLLYAQIDSAITTTTHTQSLVLLFPAIMQATSANSKLQLIVVST